MTAPMTDAELAEAEKLCELATPGDWRAGDCIEPRIVLYAVPKHRPLRSYDTITIGHTYCDVDGRGRANMKFIAAARALVPRLLAEVARLKAERDANAASVEHLVTRRDELLATIVRLTNETPFPDEVKGWTEQRAKMLAEIGTLKAERAETRRLLADCARKLGYLIRDYPGDKEAREIVEKIKAIRSEP